MSKYKIFTFIFFMYFSFSIKAVNIDSLLNITLSGKNDTNVINSLFKLGDYYSYIKPDSSIYYYNKALSSAKNYKDKYLICKSYINLSYSYIYLSEYNKAEKNLKSALEINNIIKNNKLYSSIYNNLGILYKHKNNSKKAVESFLKSIEYDKTTNNESGIASGYFNIANIYVNNGEYAKALKNYNYSKKIFNKNKNYDNLSKCYNGIGVVYYMKGNYDKAIEYFHKTLEIKQKLNDLYGMSFCYNNIGMLHYEQQNYNKAINYYNQALNIFKKQKNKIGIANSYSNIGIIYNDKNNYKKALTYYLLALKIFEDIEDNSNISTIYANIGITYLNNKKYDKALNYLNKALKIKNNINDKDGISNIYINLSKIYNELGDSIKNKSYYKKAINLANKGLKIAKEIGTKPNEKIAYESLENSYFKLKDLNNAYKYLKLFTQIKDSLFNEKKMKELESLEAKYQNKQIQEKIEKNKILIAKKDAEKKQLQIEESKQRMQKYFFIASFILVVFLALYIFKNYKQKQKANALLKEQKNKIEKIHNSLSESIGYAKNIQKNILPDFNLIKKYFSDNFLIFRPKDVVSGDFYWWTKINNNIIITIADCTGHGVPGAFMSMLGISFLREIINKEKIISTDEILNKLRNEIIIALKQTDISEGQKDGMDMAIININIDTLELEYSGANNPLYLITKKDIPNFENIKDLIENGKNLLYEIKPNKMPIGIYKRKGNFISHKIQLTKGDSIYLFSDGYADQFGGPMNKKFKYKPFKRLLLENADKPMNEQKQILETTFKNWKNNIEQVDDITIIGIKI